MRNRLIRKRLWVIPITIILLVVLAWTFRWGVAGQNHAVDRWLGQTWNAEKTAPYIPQNSINDRAQELINMDSSKIAVINQIDKQLDDANKTTSQNATYVDQIKSLEEDYRTKYTEGWLRVNQPQVYALKKDYGITLRYNTIPSTVIAEISQRVTNSIPADISDGYNEYVRAKTQAESLEKQKSDIFTVAQGDAYKELHQKVERERKIASTASLAIAFGALIWLIYLFVFEGRSNQEKEKVASLPSQKEENDD